MYVYSIDCSSNLVRCNVVSLRPSRVPQFGAMRVARLELGRGEHPKGCFSRSPSVIGRSLEEGERPLRLAHLRPCPSMLLLTTLALTPSARKRTAGCEGSGPAGASEPWRCPVSGVGLRGRGSVSGAGLDRSEVRRWSEMDPPTHPRTPPRTPPRTISSLASSSSAGAGALTGRKRGWWGTGAVSRPGVPPTPPPDSDCSLHRVRKRGVGEVSEDVSQRVVKGR